MSDASEASGASEPRKLFDFDDLSKVLADVEAMADDLKPILQAWGIDDESFMRFFFEGASLSVEEGPYAGMNEVEREAAQMMVGFFVGFKTAQELRMREQ